MVHGVLGVVLRDGVFSIDNLQFGPLLEWVLLKTQQVEDASQGLKGRRVVKTTANFKVSRQPIVEGTLTQMSCFSLMGKLE